MGVQMNRIFSILGVCLGLFTSMSAWAKPMSPDEAVAAARGWLALTGSKPMEKTLGAGGLAFMMPGTDANGQTLFYAVYLDKGGLLVLSPDDALDPVVAFSGEASDLTDPSPCNHFRLMLERDMPSQVMAARAGEVKDASVKAAKWALLRAAARDPQGVKAGLGTISDMRVKPLIATRWDQSYVYQGKTKLACYNYYTPNSGDGNANNFLCGCVATAYAQLMKFYNFPRKGPGAKGFTVTVNGVARARYLRGGDGAGGAYSWVNMPNDPAALAKAGQLTVTQRKAIGALCHDAGVASQMGYTASQSSAVFNGDPLAFTFGYVFDRGSVSENSSIPRKDINNFVNPNLDAGMPCAMAIRSSSGGHAILVDGYGFVYGAVYHHLNMGWAGSGDAWYQLPAITSSPGYNLVNRDIYNIWPVGRGGLGACSRGAHNLFVLSGRVTTYGGVTPMAGVKVVAKNAPYGSVCAPTNDVVAVTDANGRYVMKVPTDTSWIVRPQVAGSAFEPESYDQHCCLWNADFKRVIRVLRFSSSTINLGYVAVGSYQTAPLTIFNDGSGTLTISRIAASCGYVSPEPPYTIAPKSSKEVVVNLVRYAETPSSYPITFTSNCTKGSNTVTVVWSGKPPPIRY